MRVYQGQKCKKLSCEWNGKGICNRYEGCIDMRKEPYSIVDDCWISKEDYDKLPDEEKWIWDRKKDKL